MEFAVEDTPVVPADWAARYGERPVLLMLGLAAIAGLIDSRTPSSHSAGWASRW